MIIDTQIELGCLYQQPLPELDKAYMRYISQLLNCPLELLSRLPTAGNGANGATAYVQPDLDLLLYWEPQRPWWQRFLGLSPLFEVIDNAKSSVLVVNQPRIPLQRILLILRGEQSDDAAIHWLERLAIPAQAEVYVLPIVPPFPGMYQSGRIPLQAEVIMADNTLCGSQLRHLIYLFTIWDIQGSLLLDNSEPRRRIDWAMYASNCDLVILSAEPYSWVYRKLFGELLKPLLCRRDRPVLIAADALAN